MQRLLARKRYNIEYLFNRSIPDAVKKFFISHVISRLLRKGTRKLGSRLVGVMCWVSNQRPRTQSGSWHQNYSSEQSRTFLYRYLESALRHSFLFYVILIDQLNLFIMTRIYTFFILLFKPVRFKINIFTWIIYSILKIKFVCCSRYISNLYVELAKQILHCQFHSLKFCT